MVPSSSDPEQLPNGDVVAVVAVGGGRGGGGGGGGGGGDEEEGAGGTQYPTCQARNHVCELLTFCVRCHNFRIKYYLLRCNMVERVLALLEHGHTYLHLSAIRFLRCCIGHKDDFYNRFICEKGFLHGILHRFFEDGDKNNMLNSAVVELMEFVKSENLKLLITHISEKYGEKLKHIKYVETGTSLLAKYEQHQEKLHRTVDLATELQHGAQAAGGGQKRSIEIPHLSPPPHPPPPPTTRCIS